LDDYYIPTRYPNGLPGEIPAHYYDDRNEAENAIAWSEKIIKLVRGKIEDNIAIGS
jgi:HEPN domain-containing protein